MEKRISNSLKASLAALAIGGVLVGATPASAVTFTTFDFETVATRNAGFDQSSYVYPVGHALEGQVNPYVGDVRLDGVRINGVLYDQSQLQLVSAVEILQDDAVDLTRGGNNLATGYGIGANVDTWVNLGPAGTTPTADDVRDAHANYNLTSIVAIRENVGTTIYDIFFEDPTNQLLIWERGGNSDILIEAIGDAGQVVGSHFVSRDDYGASG